MNYRGRELDAVSLWAQFVSFPPNANLSGGFAPLVECPNPEHATSKKHFQVNLDKPLVHCFARCGIQGTYEHAIGLIKGISDKEARKIILQHTRVGLGPASKRKTRRADGRVGFAGAAGSDKRDGGWELDLSFDTYIPPVGLEYLSARGIEPASIARYGIGWDADERRIVIPADDERGISRFLIKRATRERDWPKYLYAPDGVSKSSLLFGACHLDRKQVSSDGLVLVEGSFDQISLFQYELQPGAILGTGLSDRQVRIIEKLNPRRVFLMFDGDLAGMRNIEIASQKLTKYPIFVCLYPKGKADPNTLNRKEAINSVEKSLSLVQFNRRVRSLKGQPKRKEVSIG